MSASAFRWDPLPKPRTETRSFSLLPAALRTANNTADANATLSCQRCVRLVQWLGITLIACGPSAEERADVAVLSRLEQLSHADGNDSSLREQLLADLQKAPQGSGIAEQARGFCAAYYQTQVALVRLLREIDQAPAQPPTAEFLSKLAAAEQLHQEATDQLEPCTQATGALRIKTHYGKK